MRHLWPLDIHTQGIVPALLHTDAMLEDRALRAAAAHVLPNRRAAHTGTTTLTGAIVLNVVPIQQDDEPSPEPTFDDFWTLYPKHVARKEAERAWAKVSPADRICALVGLVGWRREWIRRGEMQYVPHPSTWLNGERWTDELPQTNMPTHASHVLAAPTPRGERSPMPDHVRAMIAKIRAGK